MPETTRGVVLPRHRRLMEQIGIGHRFTKRVRRLPEDEIGITIGGTEYAMPISEANELVGMIRKALSE